MGTVTFAVDGSNRSGYLALPAGGKGRGILVLHAWWGLNSVFRSVCDRLASEGFVAFAPDLMDGKIATTIEEAKQLLEARDSPATMATAEAGLDYFQNHPAVQGQKFDAVGFSMGAAFALELDSAHPGSMAGIVLFYGMGGADLSQSRAVFQCHFAETDDWEPLEDVKKMTAPNAEIHIYPNTGHWFFEEDRTGYYDPDAAAVAWSRTLEFLRRTPSD